LKSAVALGSWLLLGTVAGLGLLTVCDAVGRARAQWLALSRRPNDRLLAAAVDPRWAEYAQVASRVRAQRGEPELARCAARRAVELNPLEARHWLAWAKREQAGGRNREAQEALRVAETLDPHNDRLQRAIGDYWLTQGEGARALEHQARGLPADPAAVRALYCLDWSYGEPVVAVAETLLRGHPEWLGGYFLDCAPWAAPEELERVWGLLEAAGRPIEPACYTTYFTRLVAWGRAEQAEVLWTRVARQLYGAAWPAGDNLLWNGEVRYAPQVAGGLEWVLLKQAGSESRVLPGEAGEGEVRVDFSGRENPDFSHVRHGLLLRPGGHYRLSGRIHVRHLTSDQGVFLRILVPGTSVRVLAETAPLTGSTTCKIDCEFSMPATNAWAELRLCRQPSLRLNHALGGTVRLQGLRLQPVTNVAAGPDRP
jgi:tetratricopeptide (TPR) repeat protein